MFDTLILLPAAAYDAAADAPRHAAIYAEMLFRHTYAAAIRRRC